LLSDGGVRGRSAFPHSSEPCPRGAALDHDEAVYHTVPGEYSGVGGEAESLRDLHEHPLRAETAGINLQHPFINLL